MALGHECMAHKNADSDMNTTDPPVALARGLETVICAVSECLHCD
jgi:hypothetical protein